MIQCTFVGNPSLSKTTLKGAASQSLRKCPQCRIPQTPLKALDLLQSRTQRLKCPFWRRRFTDLLDSTRQALLWLLLTRHKSLPLPPPPLPNHSKNIGLSLSARLNIIREDFLTRQYYVSGKLTRALYCDQCIFDGPDPDLPVRGLAKYVSATSGLFDVSQSRVDLLHIWEEGNSIKARWRIEGALRLPGRPTIKPYVGETVYEFDDRGLVVKHDEKWSISAIDAFVSVLWKGYGRKPAPDVETLMKEGNGIEELEGNQKDVKVV